MGKKISFFIFLVGICSLSVFAQRTGYYEINKAFREGLDLYYKEKYVPAFKMFEQAKVSIEPYKNIQAKPDRLNLLEQDIDFYQALCAYELFNNNIDYLFNTFIDNYPQSNKAGLAYFYLGCYHFREDRPVRALYFLKQATNIPKKLLPEYYYKLGYCYFLNQEYEAAEQNFTQAAEFSTKYTYPSIYYLGYLQYKDQNYDVALVNFLKLKDSKNYAGIYPYYAMDIYYRKRKFAEVQKLGTDVLNNPSLQLQNKDGIYKIMAGSYFKQDAVDKALFYYKKYLEIADINQLNETDQYQMGYCYYKSADYTNAQKCFEKLSEKSDIYAQYSLYTLADCFIKLGDKQAARNSFYKASKITSGNQQIFEESTLNYAILSYELDYHLVALSSIKDFITTFPKSERINDAKGLLSQLLLTTKNYKEALEVCEGMTSRSENVDKAFQKMLYLRGVELYNTNFIEDARKLFEKSLKVPYDLKLKALANYWIAEIAYDRKDYDLALKNYREFFNNSFCIQTDVYTMAHYSMAYAFYRANQYNESIYYFNKYIESSGENIKWSKDAMLRIGDINFQMKDYSKAIEAYDKIINNQYVGSEYALFQKGIIQGILNNQNEKIATLKALLNKYPDSDYNDDAQFEIGGAYLTSKNYYPASYEFEKLLRLYPQSSYTSKTLMNLGLVNYNESKDDSALYYYKKIVSEYPQSDEAQEALLAIKNIFVDKGNAEEYLKYSKTVNIASISIEAQDSISYKSAYNQYLKNNCDIAIKSYGNYVAGFPKGKYILDAHFERAECAYKLKEYSIAKEDLNYVMKGEKNKYFEKAAYYQATIAQSLSDTSQFIYYLQELENFAEYKGNISYALTNLMQVFNQQGKDSLAFQYANKVMRFDKSSSADVYNAKLVKAEYYLSIGDTTLAELNYKEVADSTRTLPGIKAKFAIADLLFQQKIFLKSKEICFDIINNSPNYEYWIGKAYILLAKNYYLLKNNFQAKSTLQSIIDNYQGDDDIKSTAQDALILILETEQLEKDRKKSKELLMIEDITNEGNEKK